jgi:hypothetical protein
MVDPDKSSPGELEDAQLESAAGAGIPITSQQAGSPSSLEPSLGESDRSASSEPRVKDVNDPDPWKKKPT